MVSESNLKPDAVSFANVVPAYASLANKRRIQSIHAFIIKRGLDLYGYVVLGPAMVDGYGKCLDMKATESLFSGMEKPNTATWNAMIAGNNLNHYARLGHVNYKSIRKLMNIGLLSKFDCPSDKC